METWPWAKLFGIIISNFETLYFLCRPPSTYFPSLITGDDLRPDMLISPFCNILYVVKPSVGFETSRNNDAGRKYTCLLNDLSSTYHYVKFVNLSKAFLGVFGQSRYSFPQMCSDQAIH